MHNMIYKVEKKF